MDPFELNIAGVTNLIETPTNKVTNGLSDEEGVTSDFIDLLELDMSDEELLKLKKGYENKSAPYTGKIEPRQQANKTYLFGTQANAPKGKTIPSNLLFQSTATFVPQALAKNPEPVVWSDDTDEGKEASSDVKTMLQYHADVLCLRKKLGIMVWDWSVYFIGVWKYGWDAKKNDVDISLRKPKNFVFDPDGYVNEYGDFIGEYLGERIQSTAEALIDLYPDNKEYITLAVKNQLGTLVTRTEWWNNEYSFTTYEEQILDKHKNEFFNYDDGKLNHFASPKMPYTFLSVFSLQEQPHDFTNLIEQNISNQDRITERDYQITKNLAHSNNAIAVSDEAFTVETAHQAADALEKGDPILVSGDVNKAIVRLPASPLPSGILESQEVDKQTLLGVYGTQGLTAQQPNENTTARGQILNQSIDSTRIGGGVGDALEQVADNAFNWLLQLYYVFYDEKHYASIMGAGRAVSYVKLSMEDAQRLFVVSVSPNSMKPKDEISQQNLAMERWSAQAIDPITFMKEINSADPMEDAKKLVIWNTNPQQYLQMFFPEVAPAVNTANPADPTQQAPAPPSGGESLSAPPAQSNLGAVDINAGIAQPH